MIRFREDLPSRLGGDSSVLTVHIARREAERTRGMKSLENGPTGLSSIRGV